MRKNTLNMEKKKDAEIEKALKVAQKISKVRLKKGFTLENMSDELNITTSAYRRIENGETNLKLVRLFQIAEILKEKASSFLGETENVFNQTNNDSSTGNQYQQKIENFYQENKEVYERLIASKDEQISLLKNLLETKFGNQL